MTSQTRRRMLFGPMMRSQRTDLARIKAGRCTTHNLPLTQSPFFDGGTCPAGCVDTNTSRVAFVEKSRRGWRRN